MAYDALCGASKLCVNRGSAWVHACLLDIVLLDSQSARIVCFCWQVNELQRRQRKEHEKEVKRREKLQEKEKTERATQAKLKMEEEAYQLQVRPPAKVLLGQVPKHHAAAVCRSQEIAVTVLHRSVYINGPRADMVVLVAYYQVAALAPKIEAMEASWNRLRAISGAETPEQVIEYWQGEWKPALLALFHPGCSCVGAYGAMYPFDAAQAMDFLQCTSVPAPVDMWR